jgi:hypothetical protein
MECQEKTKSKGLKWVTLNFNTIYEKVTNSVVLDSEPTTPTERPPLVGKVNANFCG